jgi:hypothetical protein
LPQGSSPSCRAGATSSLKSAVVASVKKCTPLRPMLEGASCSLASLCPTSKCSDARVSVLASCGLVATRQEALKRVATAPAALGASLGSAGLQV